MARGVLTSLLGLSAGGALAQDDAPFFGDYGGVGLWQVPTARFGEEGYFGVGIGANSPYNRLYVSVQPFDGLEAVLRYTDITNRLFSPDPEFSGDQSFKDRGVDVRLRLFKESEYLPALALGLRDLGGTQLFASQYLVASRSYYDFDFSLGLGWGRLGSGGPISNPFARDQTRTSTGNFTLSRVFSSPDIGVFGGLTWDTPINGLQAVLEYDSNDFQSEPLSNPREVRSPVNFGIKYRTDGGMAAGLSYQRGSILSFQFSFAIDLGAPIGVPKVLDPLPAASREQTLSILAASGKAESQDRAAMARNVRQSLKVQGITLSGFTIAGDGSSAQLWVAPGPYRDTRKQIGRAARAASSVLPDSVASLRITEETSGLKTFDATVDRATLEQVVSGAAPREAIEPALVITPAKEDRRSYYQPLRYPQFSWSLNPALRSSIGGPDNFYFGQLYLKLGGTVALTPGLSVDGLLGFNLYNNFDDLKLESNSELPRVRSDIKNYLQEGEQALVRLEANSIHQLGPTLYGRLSAGIFEEMYGGVAGEVLYRPGDPRFAVGLNVNRVRQRDFNQRLGFRNYEVTTGHLTGYFEWPRPSVLVKLSVGQYLAGDRGATLDVSRQFANGIRIGAFATKTNVSAQQFGEGEFDKGVYLNLPLDVVLPRSSGGGGGFFFRPLTRDGGQMVRDGRSLYDLTYGAVKARLPLRDNLFFE